MRKEPSCHLLMAFHDESEGLRILRNVLQATPAVDCNTKLEENWHSSVKIDLRLLKYHSSTGEVLPQWFKSANILLVSQWSMVHNSCLWVSWGEVGEHFRILTRPNEGHCCRNPPITTTNGWTFSLHKKIHIYKFLTAHFSNCQISCWEKDGIKFSTSST
jgi:hypothetical protein